MAGRTSGLRSGEKKDGRGAILRIDGLMRQGSLGVKFGQQVAERLVRRSLVERNGVFVERSDEPVSRKHRGAFHNGCGTDSVHSYLGSQGNCQFANEMIYCGFAYVISFAASLRNDGIGRA